MKIGASSILTQFHYRSGERYLCADLDETNGILFGKLSCTDCRYIEIDIQVHNDTVAHFLHAPKIEIFLLQFYYEL